MQAGMRSSRDQPLNVVACSTPPCPGRDAPILAAAMEHLVSPHGLILIGHQFRRAVSHSGLRAAGT